MEDDYIKTKLDVYGVTIKNVPCVKVLKEPYFDVSVVERCKKIAKEHLKKEIYIADFE